MVATRAVLLVAVALAVGQLAAGQVDPFAQYNEAPSAGLAASAPLTGVNYAGMAPAGYGGGGVVGPGAAAADPYAAYGAGYGAADPTTSTGVTVVGGAPAAADPMAAYQQQLAAYYQQQQAAAAAGPGATLGVPAAAEPAAAAPAAPPPAAPKPAPKPLPPGMMPRDWLGETAQANKTVLPKIRVKKGFVVTEKLTFVCSDLGTLYIGVGDNGLVECPSNQEVDLAKITQIEGLQKLKCPPNPAACPGNRAVQLIVELQNTYDEFAEKRGEWVATIAVGASVKPSDIAITDVLVLDKAGVPKRFSSKPADEEEEDKPADKKAAKKEAEAAPAAPKGTIAARRAKGGSRRLFQEPVSGRILPEDESYTGRNNDTSATVETITDEDLAVMRSNDTEAEVEVGDDGPKALIRVTTHIQPLTDMEAMSVRGTLGSQWFDSTFRSGMKQANLTVIGDRVWSITSPAPAYVFPEERNLTAKQRAEKQGNATAKANATLSGVIDLKKRPKVNISDPESVKRAAAEEAAAANGSANGTDAAKSGARGTAAVFGAAAVHVGLLVGGAAMLIL